MNAQNAYKCAPNQINSRNTSKIELMETPETPEINRKLSKSKKHPVLTFYRYWKTAKKQSII